MKPILALLFSIVVFAGFFTVVRVENLRKRMVFSYAALLISSLLFLAQGLSLGKIFEKANQSWLCSVMVPDFITQIDTIRNAADSSLLDRYLAEIKDHPIILSFDNKNFRDFYMKWDEEIKRGESAKKIEP